MARSRDPFSSVRRAFSRVRARARADDGGRGNAEDELVVTWRPGAQHYVITVERACTGSEDDTMDHGLACPLMHDIAESVPRTLRQTCHEQAETVRIHSYLRAIVRRPRTLALSSARDHALHNAIGMRPCAIAVSPRLLLEPSRVSSRCARSSSAARSLILNQRSLGRRATRSGAGRGVIGRIMRRISMYRAPSKEN